MDSPTSTAGIVCGDPQTETLICLVIMFNMAHVIIPPSVEAVSTWLDLARRTSTRS